MRLRGREIQGDAAMRPSFVHQSTRMTVDSDFDFMPLADETAIEEFGQWLDGELEQLEGRWSAWITDRANRAAEGRGAQLA
jgi:hypothetical protein